MSMRVCLFVVMAATIGMTIASRAEAEEAPGADAEAQPGEAAAATAAPVAGTPATAAPTAAAPATAAPAAETPGAAAPAESERPAQPAAVSEAVVRLGRIEMILIQNEDPESAIEFALQVIEQDGDAPRPQMLIAASYMLLEDPTNAIVHYVRAIRLSERSDPEAHLHALYGLARALQRSGQLTQAADAYDQYVAYAGQHSDITNFVEIAQRLSRVLRARAGAGRRRR